MASCMGGRTVPRSGASTNPYAKGDVRSDSFLIECKLTEGKGYRLTTKVLEKITNEAYKLNKSPVLQLDLGGRQYVVMLYQDFYQMGVDAGYIHP